MNNAQHTMMMASFRVSLMMELKAKLENDKSDATDTHIANSITNFRKIAQCYLATITPKSAPKPISTVANRQTISQCRALVALMRTWTTA